MTRVAANAQVSGPRAVARRGPAREAPISAIGLSPSAAPIASASAACPIRDDGASNPFPRVP